MIMPDFPLDSKYSSSSKPVVKVSQIVIPLPASYVVNVLATKEKGQSVPQGTAEKT